MHHRTKWHSNQNMDYKDNRIEKEITLKNASKDEMAQ